MATPKTVAFHTLGCKLNYSETSTIKRLFEDKGYGAVPFDEGADIYVINTCSVTDFADRKCRKIVRQALKKAPHAQVIVTGCYAQLKPKEISEIPGVDLVLGAAEKFRITDYVDEISKAPGKNMVAAGDIWEATSFNSSFSFGDRTRSFLKVQDGCDYKCSFCTIPMARGKSRSDTIENVVSNAKEIAEKGIQEIVLTGVNIGDFGTEKGVPSKDSRFIDLIKALDEIEGINRFRISSIEPNLCSDEVIEFVANSKKFVPHFHMPLQSGNNKQLKEMRRRYKRELYADRVAKIKSLMPHCCIGVDVIVGFPNETKEDFLESYNFINELDVSYLHVFTYSERKNTLAAEMPAVVEMGERRRRNEMLRILSQKKQRFFYEQFVGQERPVLFEQHKDKTKLSGFTDNYVKIEMPFEAGKINTIAKVQLNNLQDNCVMFANTLITI